MKWYYKAIIQKWLSFLPFSFQLNFLLQGYVSIGKELPLLFVIDRIKTGLKHIDNYNTYGNNSTNSTNRLRHSDYQKHFSIHFKTLAEQIEKGKPKELEMIRLHKKFAEKDTDDLLVKQIFNVLRKKKK